jgi:hypothetical protein
LRAGPRFPASGTRPGTELHRRRRPAMRSTHGRWRRSTETRFGPIVRSVAPALARARLP